MALPALTEGDHFEKSFSSSNFLLASDGVRQRGGFLRRMLLSDRMSECRFRAHCLQVELSSMMYDLYGRRLLEFPQSPYL